MHAWKSPLRHTPSLSLAAAALLLLAGCGEEPTIETYEAPRSNILSAASGRQAPASASPAQRQQPTGDDALFVAMVQRGDMSWFYKVTGKNLPVSQHVQDFMRVIGGVLYNDEDNTAEWTVPEGWEETIEESSGEGPSRLATLSTGEGANRVELAISKFPRMGDDQDAWQLMNVNRWLRQIGYAPVTAEELDQVAQETDFAGETALIFFKVGQVNHPPTMDPLLTPSPTASEQPAAAATLPDGMTYTVPENWTKGELNQFRKDAYVTGEGDSRVDITMSRLGPSPLAANVNRWRDQIGLPNLSEEEIQAEQQTLTAAGNEVPYFVLNSPADAAQPQTILVAIVEVEGAQWFFKMWGPPEAVTAEKQRFEDLVESIEFE